MSGDIGVIELNDCELKFSYNGKCYTSSGFATLSGQSVIFGEQARKQARLQPLVSFSQYWNQLCLSRIQHGNDRFRHYGDFAYHQLLQLHANAPECKEVILVIPASFNREQLSLLLGICDTCPFKVIGMVDNAVIAIADKVAHGHYLYLDMQLHQCLLTEIKVDHRIHVHSADIIEGTGLINLYHHWAKYLNTQFIQQCRFDPMHDAKSEQALYDLLPQLLTGKSNDEQVQLSLEGKQLTLNRQSLARHTQGLFVPVLSAVKELGHNDCNMVTSHIVRVPELFNQLGNTYVIEDDAVAQNVIQHQQNICSDNGQVSFITSLPSSNLSHDPVPSKAAERSTHLLWQNKAYPIRRKPIYITSMPELKLSTKATPSAQYLLEPKEHSLTLTLLNGSGARINGKVGRNGDMLSLGDELTLGSNSQMLTLINVVEDENW